MYTIKKKEYNWSNFHVYGELVGGFGAFLFGFSFFLQGTVASAFLAIVFFVISVYSFLHFFFLIKNKTYIQIANDGLKIYPKFFMGHVKVIEWKNISKIIKNNRMKITLCFLTGKNIKIPLIVLKKDERASLVHIIDESIENSLNENSTSEQEVLSATSAILPESFICPNCYEELELDKSERTAKKFTCPNCNNVIDLTRNKKERNEQSEESKDTILESPGISTKIPVENIVESLRKNSSEKELCYVVLFGDRPLTAKAQNNEDSIMCFTQRNKAEDFILGYSQYYQTTKPLTVLAIDRLAELWAMLHNNANDELYEPPYALLINFNYSGQTYNMYTKLDLMRFGFKGFQKGFNMFLK